MKYFETQGIKLKLRVKYKPGPCGLSKIALFVPAVLKLQDNHCGFQKRLDLVSLSNGR